MFWVHSDTGVHTYLPSLGRIAAAFHHWTRNLHPRGKHLLYPQSPTAHEPCVSQRFRFNRCTDKVSRTTIDPYHKQAIFIRSKHPKHIYYMLESKITGISIGHHILVLLGIFNAHVVDQKPSSTKTQVTFSIEVLETL